MQRLVGFSGSTRIQAYELTSSTVAENLRVPLYVISGGDLGTKPTEVETSLNTALEVVARWNAVLLLDEAVSSVFLPI